MRHSIEYIHGSGILTGCPSTTLFSLALGPTHPGMITMAQETLNFRRERISLSLWLLIPTFSLPYAPRWVTPVASSPMERSPTIVSYDTIRSFGTMFEPRYIVGARPLD